MYPARSQAATGMRRARDVVTGPSGPDERCYNPVMSLWSCLWARFRRRHSRRASPDPTLVRDELRAFIEDGQLLLMACENEDAPLPLPVACRWAERVEAFLLAQLGPYHVYLFRAGRGLPSEHDTTESGDRIHLWQVLRERMGCLEQFLSEAGSRTARATAAGPVPWTRRESGHAGPAPDEVNR